MSIIPLTVFDLSLAALMILGLAFAAWLQGLGIARDLLISALRTAIQLSLIGLVLKSLFAHAALHWVVLMALVMLTVAAFESTRRQKRRLLGGWGFSIGAMSLFISSFAVTLTALTVVISPAPWYAPQYAIPLLGMMLGNTVNGIALSLDRLLTEAWREKGVIEARLALGHPYQEAMAPLRRNALRSGMIPTINAMAVAGIVSLPGMMTGQILGGNPPEVAVRYQILIMFMVSAGTGFGAMMAVAVATRRLFDQRQRLRLDRLSTPSASIA